MEDAVSVTQLNRHIANLFHEDPSLFRIAVRGEISGCKYHSSGHIYFTLKDASSSLSCVMFASWRRNLGFHLEDGQGVIVQGRVRVYEWDGRYQLYAQMIRQDGIGRLYE